MVETIVAIAVIMVVMGSLTGYFVSTTRINHLQGERQIAVQLADDAMERVRALKAGALLTGRDKESVENQWGDPTKVGAVSRMLAEEHTRMEFDGNAAPGAGATAALPTSPRTVTLSGISYRQHFYIGICERPGQVAAECVAAPSGTAGSIPFYRVIVAVTWPNARCTDGLCSYVSSSLITRKSDEPVFNTGADVLELDEPGSLSHDVNAPVSQYFPAAGGEGNLIWSASGLPDGLSINSGTGEVTGTPSAVKSYSNARVTVIDATGQQDYVAFIWDIKALPTLGTISAASTTGGVMASMPFTVTGGTAPYTWTATGLPPGVKLDADTTETGTVSASGTPNTTGKYPVTVRVTDKHGQASAKSFDWTVPALAVSNVSAPALKAGAPITNLQLTATGGIKPYTTWASTGLPAGLSLNTSTGVISGTPRTPGRYSVELTVTDSKSATARLTTDWTVS
jgi:type II secretory pathway pseudopilin PulG